MSRNHRLPPLAGEGHVCPSCRLSYAEISTREAEEAIASVPLAVREAVASIPPRLHHTRPDATVWSIAEYVCHLRDVYATFTIRLHRARTEERPVLEPMLNDLRARRFRYNERDVSAVLDELEATAAGFCEEATHMGPHDWDRVVTRLPGEQRTARWLIRQAMHEGQHHRRDIKDVGIAVAGKP